MQPISPLRVVLLNGPPSSGKDTAANFIVEDFRRRGYLVYHERFSKPLKHFWGSALGHDTNVFGWNGLEATKEQKIPALGLSYRDCQISLSEDYMKERFGINVFGRLMVERLRRYRDLYGDGRPVLVVIPDSGFAEEARPVVDAVGADSVLLLRLCREGTTYTGDSRSYIQLPDVRSIAVVNQDKSIFTADVCQIVREWYEDRNDNDTGGRVQAPGLAT